LHELWARFFNTNAFYSIDRKYFNPSNIEMWFTSNEKIIMQRSSHLFHQHGFIFGDLENVIYLNPLHLGNSFVLLNHGLFSGE
jgi:hypothetical protein